MRLLPKLLLLMVGVAAIPLGLAGYNSIRISQDVTRTQVREAQLRLAENITQPVHAFLQETAFALVNAGHSYDFASLPPGERNGALKLVFLLLPQVDVISLQDPAGASVVPPVALAPGEDPEGSRGRASRTQAELDEFLAKLPFAAAKKSGTSASAPYAYRGTRGPHVAMAVPLDSGLVLGAEISLDHVSRSLDAFHLGERGEAFLLDRAGVIALHRDAAKTGKSLAAEPFIAERLRERASGAGEFTDAAGVRWTGAYAPIGPGIDWGIVVAQPEADAFVASVSLRNQTALWLVASLLFAVVLAGFYANEVRRPIGAVADGARALAGGALGTRITTVDTKDEVGDLANAFNEMATRLQAQVTEIERQNEEIRAWNATLSLKVDERTRALREAQARLVQTKKLAALGELGAGVAHELNNPLAAVRGFAQLLIAHRTPEDKEMKALKTIEEQAGRCSEIVTRLLRFSQEATRTAREKVDLHKVLSDALTLVEGRIRDADVKIHQELAAALPPILGSAGELREVIWHILSNARNAMSGGGNLTIRTWSEVGKQGEEVKISFGDTGKGIDPEIADRIFEPFFTTKTEWRGTGLGLAVVHRIMTDHGGTVDVASEPGKGALFTLAFPVATADFAEGPKPDEEITGPRPKTQLV